MLRVVSDLNEERVKKDCWRMVKQQPMKKKKKKKKKMMKKKEKKRKKRKEEKKEEEQSSGKMELKKGCVEPKKKNENSPLVGKNQKKQRGLNSCCAKE
jgi:hypothetical protein